MLYSNEMCTIKDNDVKRQEHTGKTMVRWIFLCYCEILSRKLRSRLGNDSMSNVMRTSRLHWTVHMEKKKK